MKRILVVIGLVAMTSVANAQDTSGQYTVHALGVKVGDLAIAGSVTQSKYTVSSQFVTSGLVSTVAGVRFLLRSSGSRKGTKFSPRSYSEDMDTGKRETRVALSYRNGVARASGTERDGQRPYPVSDAQQRGAVDPLTAIFMVMRDQSPDEVCKLNQRVFDGERLTEMVLTQRRESDGKVICSGVFRRVAGYSQEDLRKNGQFGVTVTYAPAGSVMQATRVQAETIYGAASIRRR